MPATLTTTTTTSAIASAPSVESRPVRLARTVQRALGRPLVLFASLAAFIPFYVVYFGSSAWFSMGHAAAACAGQPVLDSRWSYGAQSVSDYLSACGATGRAAILGQQAGDLLYPALYALVLGSAIALLLRALRPKRGIVHLLVLLPLVTAGLDYVENAGIRTLLGAYPLQPSLFPWLPAITGTKLALGYVCWAVVAGLLGALGRRFTRARRSA